MKSKEPKTLSNLMVEIANEAIKRTQKKIDLIQATIDDRPIEEIIEIDKQIDEITSKYSNVKSLKELNKLGDDSDVLKKKRAECWRRFNKQKNLGRHYDMISKLEKEKELYERASRALANYFDSISN